MSPKTTSHWKIRHIGNGRYLTAKEWMLRHYVEDKVGLPDRRRQPMYYNDETDTPFFDPARQSHHCILTFKTHKKAKAFIERFNEMYEKEVEQARKFHEEMTDKLEPGNEEFKQPPHPLMAAVLVRFDRTVEVSSAVEGMCISGSSSEEIRRLEKEIAERIEMIETLRAG